jgi:hypothetical protein
MTFDSVIHTDYCRELRVRVQKTWTRSSLDHCLFYLLSFFCIESETNLETIRQSYLNTVNELNLELLAIKDQSFINNQEPDTQTIGKYLLTDVEDSLYILLESSSSDSNLDEINRIYEELRNILPISNEASLEEIILSINNLIKEKNLFEVKEIILTKDLESVNQQLMDVYHQCEQLQEYNQQLLVGKQGLEIEI